MDKSFGKSNGVSITARWRAASARVQARAARLSRMAQDGSLSVDAMAEALERPGELAGMHFFNPVHRMPLVEVVRGAKSSDEAVATVHRLALDLGKVPVVVADGAGFVVNRILGPYLNEAGWLLSDGATIEEIAKKLDWQQHTVRGAIAGALKRKLGLDVRSEKQDARGRVYRLNG